MDTNKTLSYLTLLSGLSISVVAIYYSVCGLISIFSGAMIPILIMGTVLEVSKLVATVWLKQYWKIIPKLLQFYLSIAIIILMLITSLGIFGFLSRAHLEQSVSAGDIADKIALIDDKIQIQEDTINSSRKSIEQLNAAVDQTMTRSTSERGANRSITVRKMQQKERDFLQNSITVAQEAESALRAEKLPLEQQLRKEKVEFGPLVYISALLYGDEEKNLDNAVRYVIILIVIVFDPLAVVLLLCSQYSFNYIREQKVQPSLIIEKPKPVVQAPPVHVDASPEYWDNLMADMEKWKTLPESDINYPDDFIEEDPLEVDDLIEEVDDGDPVRRQIRAAKMKWKAENKHDTIKRQERLLNLGLINKLPWSK